MVVVVVVAGIVVVVVVGGVVVGVGTVVVVVPSGAIVVVVVGVDEAEISVSASGKLTMPPDATRVSKPATAVDVSMRMSLTSPPVRLPFRPFMITAIPATCGVAIDVPDM